MIQQVDWTSLKHYWLDTTASESVVQSLGGVEEPSTFPEFVVLLAQDSTAQKVSVWGHSKVAQDRTGKKPTAAVNCYCLTFF
jgi:hypothetical protein